MWYSPLCSECFVSIPSGEVLCYKFRTVLECSLNVVWRVGFMNQFVCFITISFFGATSWSKLSKGGVLSFFRLCCKVSPPYKASVEEGQLCFILGNAFAFAQYSKMFPPFTRYTPSFAFHNGGYNFKVRIPFEIHHFFTLSFSVHWSSFLNSFYIYNKHK